MTTCSPLLALDTSEIAPALVIAGANSPTMFRRLVGLLAVLLSDSRAVEITGASHGMHVENPTVVNAAVLRFLGDVTVQQTERTRPRSMQPCRGGYDNRAIGLHRGRRALDRLPLGRGGPRAHAPPRLPVRLAGLA